MLNHNLQKRFAQTLCKVPGMDDRQGRTALLAGLPQNVVAGLPRSSNCLTDMMNLITRLDQLGPLDSDDWPLLILIDNASQFVEGAEIGQDLKAIRKTLADFYSTSDKKEQEVGGIEDAGVPGLRDSPKKNKRIAITCSIIIGTAFSLVVFIGLFGTISQSKPGEWIVAWFKPTPTAIATPPPTHTPTSILGFTGKVCMIKSGGDTNTIFLRETEFKALGLPIGTKVTVTVLDTGKSVGGVTLSLDGNLNICSVRLAKPLREALGVDADTAIKPESNRPDRQFDITETSPPTNDQSIDFQGKVCQIKSGMDENTIFLRQPEYNTFGVPAGTTVSVTVLDTGRTVEKVWLGLDSDLATCSVRLAKSLREALEVAGDTDIDSPGDRPDRQFSVSLPQP